MALVVFFMMGIALWHFTVFLPDRFWQGIVGAFIGAVIGVDGLRHDRPGDQRQKPRRHRSLDRSDRDPRRRDRAGGRLGDRRRAGAAALGRAQPVPLHFAARRARVCRRGGVLA